MTKSVFVAKPAHHTPGGRFRNPEGSLRQSLSPKEIFPFMLKMLSSRFRELVIPDGHVLSHEEVQAGWERHAGGDSMTWLGHAAFLFRFADTTILVDPYLSDYASPVPFMGPKRFVPPAIPVDKLPPIDIILQTHNHYDHLDKATLKAIPNKSGIQVITALGVGRHFRKWGYSNVEELDWFGSYSWGELKFTALPAVHFSRRGLFDTNRDLWAGFAIESPRQRIYFSGDTAHHESVFHEIGDRVGPFDLAIVGIGAYEPQSIMKPVHANPEEGVQIALDAKAKRVMGMHWGTIVLSAEEPFEPPKRFLKSAEKAGFAEDQRWILGIGETRSFPVNHT